jgi:hypothetical protein
MDSGKLDKHAGAPWIVECVRDFIISVLQKSEGI